MNKRRNLRPTTTRARASKRSAPGSRARIETRIPKRYARAIRAVDLQDAAHAALRAAGKRAAWLTIAIGGDALLRKLNHEFLGIDAPTDVLSFGEMADQSSDTPDYLGDVVISWARARAQAKLGGHPPIDELRLLVIHGVLHLLGYDHDTPRRKKQMWAVQADALRRIGASIHAPVE